MTQPYLISQRIADKLIAATGKLPEGFAVYPPLRTSWPTECVWLRALGDFAHVHPISQPCPFKKKR